jgi:hypothetical protein
MKVEKLQEGWPWVWKQCKSIRKVDACHCKKIPNFYEKKISHLWDLSSDLKIDNGI